MENTKVLDAYKVLTLLFGIREPSFQVSVIKKIINAKNFSEIDDGALKMIEGFPESLLSRPLEELKQFFSADLIAGMSSEDWNLLKKSGINVLRIQKDPTSGEKEILGFFPNERAYKAMLNNFRNDISCELKKREKKIEKLGVKEGRSNDDSILAAFDNKLSKCKDLDDVEALLGYYMQGSGADLMNGFLRGDLTTVKKRKLKSQFGGSNNISFSLLLDSALKALALRKITMYGTLDDVTTVYRGMGINGFLKCIKVDENKLSKEFTDVKKVDDMLVNYVNKHMPLFQSASISSTSLEKSIAETFAELAPDEFKIIMEISLKKGTAFGKNISKTFAGSGEMGQLAKEIILKPMQKIKVKSAELQSPDFIVVECETIS